MNHKSLSLTLGGAIAASITLAPVVNAAENPFAMQAIAGSQHLAEAGAKTKEGKCGEGKCSSRKMKEGGCSASKMKEGGCSGAKMKEGGCSGAKMKEGGCSGAKMKEGGCSGSMKTDETAPSAP